MRFLRRPELHAAFRSTYLFYRALLLLLVLLLPVEFVSAQNATSGTIVGIVVLAGSHPAADASLTFQSLSTSVVYPAQTRADGSFSVPALPPGQYLLLAGENYLPATSRGVFSVAQAETLTLHVDLSQAAASRSRVPAASPLHPDQDADGLFSLGGLPSTENALLLDGATLTQGYGAVPAGAGVDPAPDPDDDSDSAERTTGPTHGLGRGRHRGIAYAFSEASVREFRLGTDIYSAQLGHAGAAISTVTTRSGSAALHGSAFFNLRSSALAAAEPFAIATTYASGVSTSSRVKPHDLLESFGATVGGPLAPQDRKLFFFYTYDEQKRGFPAVSSPSDPGFYNLTSVQSALLANRGVSVAAAAKALTYISSLTGLTGRRADQQLHFVRVDWLEHAPFRSVLQFNRVRWSSPAGLLEAPVVARGRGSLGTASGSLDSVLLRISSSFSPSTLNEFRIAYLRDLQYETPQAPLPQEPAIGPGGRVPEVVIGPNGLLFGAPAGLSQAAFPDERRIEMIEAFTLVRARHTFAFGGEAAFLHDRVATLDNPAGTFHYDSSSTSGHAGGLVDFITDSTFSVDSYPNGACPSINAAVHLFCFQSFTQGFAPSANVTVFSTQEYAAFAEDTWRPRPRLTLHAGVRYEYTLLPVPTSPNSTLDALFGARGSTSIFPEDRNNFGPRASAAVALSRSLTVRAGYGLFFGRLPGATLRQTLSETALASSSTRIRIRPGAVIGCPQVPSQGFGYPCSFLAMPAGAVASTTSAVVFDRRFRLPVVQQGNLTLEQDFGRRTVVSLGYAVNVDRQLSGSTDLNIAPSTSSATFQLQGGTGAPGVRSGETFVLPLYTARVSPAFGPVTAISSHSNGTYHALAVGVRSAPSPSLVLEGSYTWSKAIDDAPALSATPRTDTQLDPYTNGYDKSLSSLNQPWVAHVSAAWTPHPRRDAHGALRGFRVTPLVSARAGRPYSFDLFGGPALNGGHESINGSGGALYLPTVGRNTLRLPATVTADLRVGRDFRAAQRVHVGASVLATNLFNHQNVSAVNQRAFLRGTPVAGVTPLVFQSSTSIATEGLNTTPVGTPTAASTETARARQIAFSLVLAF